MSLPSELWINKRELHFTGTSPTPAGLSKYVDTGEVVNSKIRKFFFLLHDKKIERDLRVTISVAGDHSGERNVVLELTNDLNPVFLFTLCVTKQDFEHLRVEQGLNIEFKEFPEALASLLDQCINSDAETEGRFKLMLNDYCGTSAGCRIMDMQKIQIKIIEECAFKNICHLTLDIMRGTEVQIRQKLELEIYMTKQALLKKSKIHDETLMNMAEFEKAISGQSEVIQQLHDEIKDLEIKKEEEIIKERNRAETREKQLRDDYNDKISQEQKKFQIQSTHVQSKLESLEKELKILHENQVQMQTIIHEKERDNEHIGGELMSTKQEINQLRSQNEKLDSDYHDKDKTVNILRTRLAVAEQELKDNSILISNHKSKLDELVLENNKLQTETDYFKSKIDKRETTIKNLTDEILKANQIISKQHSKNNTLSAKISEYETNRLKLEQGIQLKENILLKQNEVVNNLQEELNFAKGNTVTQSETIASLQKEIKELNDNLKCKSEAIANMRENFKSNVKHDTVPSQKSLISFRTYLSLPSLLPSDEQRCTGDLCAFLMESNTNKINRSTLKIKPFIYRYLKRFLNVPPPIFASSSATQLEVIVSPRISEANQSNLSKIRSQSQEDVRPETEYEYFQGVNHIGKVQSDTSVSSIKICNSQYYEPSMKHFNNNDNTNNPHKEIKERSEFPKYAPVGSFLLKPVARFTEAYNAYREESSMKLGSNLQGSTLRHSPAVKAPPLTAMQRQHVPSNHAQRPQPVHARKISSPTKIVGILKPSNSNSVTYIPMTSKNQVSNAGTLNPLEANPIITKHLSKDTATIQCNTNKLSAFETSGLSEPSAYFAS